VLKNRPPPHQFVVDFEITHSGIITGCMSDKTVIRMLLMAEIIVRLKEAGSA
jgi:hypothetical protein